MSAHAETHEFKSEARQLLHLMIHSLYSNKEVFLRELISNSSDALDKLRFEAISRPDLMPEDHALEIRVSSDEASHTLTISDTGVGMSRQEVIDNLGTIARSGTREFVDKLRDASSPAQAERLIGQFGVGFYASFMVADEVEVVTRRAGEHDATRWRSTGDGSFSVEDAQRLEPGTTITLHLREVDEDDGLLDFSKPWVLRTTIKKYSDFVQHPIKLKSVRKEQPTDDDGEPIDDAQPVERVEWETVNSMKAIWTRPQSEVDQDEYDAFYKHVARDWTAPRETIAFKAEGMFEYHALLFIPGRAPHDLFYRNATYGLQLHVNRVMVMEHCADLLPDYLRFVKGVVDSPDLSLNVSREMLQKDRRVAQIRKRVTRKVLDALTTMQEDAPERFVAVWNDFGKVIKEGVPSETNQQERLHSLLWFQTSRTDPDTSTPDAYTSLAGYIARMPEDQEAIYYITGDARDAVAASPHIEAFLERGYEVLFLTDPIDEFLVDHLREFDGKPLRSVGKGDVELGSDEEREQAEKSRAEKQQAHADLLAFIQRQLEDHVKEVRLSSRLTSSPVCMVSDEQAFSPHLERMLRQAGQSDLPSNKRILEINPDHPVLSRMQTLFNDDATSPTLADYAHLLHGQALLSEGSPLPDPVGFSKRVATLMASSP